MCKGRCKTCKYWQVGTITVYSAGATYWDGKPHKFSGTAQTECFRDDQSAGKCLASGGDKFWIYADEGGYASIVTDASFGCILYDAALQGHDFYRRDRYDFVK